MNKLRKRKPEMPVVRVADGAYVNMVASLGTQRDKASYGQFATLERVSSEVLERMYAGDWLSRKIVQRPAQDMLRAGWYWHDMSASAVTRLDDGLKPLHVVERLQELLVKVRLYGWAFLMLGIDDGLTLDQPLDKSGIKPGSLQFLTVLTDQELRPVPTSVIRPELSAGRLALPEWYDLVIANTPKGRVHHSRIIRMDQDEGIGDPERKGWSVLQSIYQELLRYASVNAGAASLLHEAKIDVIRTPGLVDRLIDSAQQVMERFAAVGLMKGLNGMLVLDKEEEYDSKSYAFGGLPELMREFAIQTAGAADIPYTILFGQSPAGMNATGEHDTRNYYDGIATRQEWQLRPIMQHLLSLVAQSLGITEQVQFTFNPLWQLDPKTRSEIEKSNSERDKTYLEAGVITEEQVARQLVADGTYTVIDDQHINDLAAMTGQQHDGTITGTGST